MILEWDPSKHERNLLERGFGFDLAARVFGGETVESVSPGRSSELRVLAVGEVDGLVLAVVYTQRGDTRRIISARSASRKERARWHER